MVGKCTLSGVYFQLLAFKSLFNSSNINVSQQQNSKMLPLAANLVSLSHCPNHTFLLPPQQGFSISLFHANDIQVYLKLQLFVELALKGFFFIQTTKGRFVTSAFLPHLFLSTV